MEAIILAGGMGTRLKPCVENLPKPLAPIDGKPFLRYLLDYLYVNGIHRAIISTGYKAEIVEEFIGKSHRGMTVEYCREDSPLGTGGAIKKALGMCREKCAVVINGDTYFDVNLSGMKMFHDASGCRISLAAKWIENAENSGLLQHENGILCGFHEKGIMSAGLINGGIYFIEKNALDGISEEKFSFEKQILETAYCPVSVYESDGYFIDIGIPENYKKAEREKEKLFSKRTRKAVFLDRDGTINYDTGHLFRTEDLRLLENADKAIAEIKSKGYLSIVITNQAGIAKGLYTAEDVDNLHSHIDSVLYESCGVTADAYYYCPHHPDAVVEELRKECLCRKPNSGLILKAVSDFSDIGIEIDLKNSITVGNRASDILAGKNAGTGQNILVGNDDPDAKEIASAHYDNLYDFSHRLKQVL